MHTRDPYVGVSNPPRRRIAISKNIMVITGTYKKFGKTILLVLDRGGAEK